MAEYAIEARDLVYTYEDGTKALNGISFRAEAGKITGILGSNGAGKSTLFLNLNGVRTPSSGQVLLSGEPVTFNKQGLRRLRKEVGIVFQDPDNQLFSATYDNGAGAAMGSFAAYSAIPGVDNTSVFFEPINSLVSGTLTIEQWKANIISATDQMRANLL